MWIISISNFENELLTSEYVKKQIQIWNIMYLNYKKYIIKGKAYLIKYELLLQNPHDELNKIAKIFNLTAINDVYTFEKNKLNPNTNHTIGSCSNIEFNEHKYDNPNISELLTKKIITVINKNIDVTLMEFYGYELEKTQ